MEHPQHEAGALSRGRVDLWSAYLAQPASTVAALLPTLSQDERDRAAKYRFEQHRTRFVVARSVLRSILAQYLGIDPGHVEFAYGPAGKPELTGRAGETLTFNLSHSDDWAVYAIGSGRAVGIDLECVRVLSDTQQIARHVCSPREFASFGRGDLGTQDEILLAYWTCKEAYLKARGEGLSRPLPSIEIELGPGETARLGSVNGDEYEASRWRLERLSPAPGYVAALVVEGIDCVLTPFECALPAAPQ